MTFYCLRFETPSNLKGQVTVFKSPRIRVAQLYPQALDSLFVASYESQGYGGGIRPRLHTGHTTEQPVYKQAIGKHALQRWSYCWKRCLLFGLCKVVISRTTGGDPVSWMLAVQLSSTREAMMRWYYISGDSVDWESLSSYRYEYQEFFWG
jgi:hypothetical protein